MPAPPKSPIVVVNTEEARDAEGTGLSDEDSPRQIEDNGMEVTYA